MPKEMCRSQWSALHQSWLHHQTVNPYRRGTAISPLLCPLCKASPLENTHLFFLSRLLFQTNFDLRLNSVDSPQSYDHVIVSIPDEVIFRLYALEFLIPDFVAQIAKHREKDPVPQQGAGLTTEQIRLDIKQDGDSNLIWWNILQCVLEMNTYYLARPSTERYSPKAECIIQRGFYLEGTAKMISTMRPQCNATSSTEDI